MNVQDVLENSNSNKFWININVFLKFNVKNFTKPTIEVHYLFIDKGLKQKSLSLQSMHACREEKSYVYTHLLKRYYNPSLFIMLFIPRDFCQPS